MSRPARVFFEGAVYHVYNRLARGERVFEDEVAAESFRSLLHDVRLRDGLTVFAWSLLPNHFHLAVRVGAVPLERPLRSLQQRVTRGVNARSGVFGPLWQGRYRAKLVTEQRYLDQLLIYIHLNPLTAGLTADPASYRWSGHREILGKARDPIVDVDEVLRVFGTTRRSARAAYVRRLKGAVEEEWVGERPGRLPWWRLGRPRRGEDEDPEAAVRERRGGKFAGPGDRPRLTAEGLIELGSNALRVAPEELRSRLRGRRLVEARELLAVLGRERYGLRVVDIAAALRKSPDAVTKAISRVTRRRIVDPQLREDIDRLDRAVAEAAARDAGDNSGRA